MEGVMVVRPSRPEDLSDIMDMVDRSGFGLTNLPKDRDLIGRRIEDSVLAFSRPRERRRDASYLLVMEEISSGRVVGTGGIVSVIGVGEPFYAYRIDTHIHESRSLGIRKENLCLHLQTIHEGPCEIGSLFVHPDFQRHGHGRLMSLSRFVFLADHQDLFPQEVIAEMRGVVDETGRSPFWEAVGRPFFDIDFPRADYLSVKDKRFIAELMPNHPIYVVLLPEEARSVIGQVHEKTRPALEMLRQEGFREAGMIDIFDGGPIIRCPVKDIRAVRESQRQVYTGIHEPGRDFQQWLVATGDFSEFRACLSPGFTEEEDGVKLPRRVIEALGLKPGDTVRYAALRANPPENRRVNPPNDRRVRHGGHG